MVIRLPDSWSNWNLENVGFWGEGKTWVSGQKPLGAKERTNYKLNPHMVDREDHTTDCWINLLRIPKITIVTSSLYNIFFYATRPGIKGRESKNLQSVGIWYQELIFRYFQVFLLPGFYSIVFFLMFFFSLFICLKKK